MAKLILPSKRVVQPQFPAKIRADIPRPTALFIGSAGLLDYLHNTTSAPIGATALSTGREGRSVTFSTSAINRLPIHANSNVVFPDNSNATILVYRRRLGATLNASSLFGYSSTGINNVVAYAPYSDGVIYWDFGTNTTGRVTVAGLSFDTNPDAFIFLASSTRGREIWRNGSLVAADVTKTVARPSNTLAFNIGSVYTNNDGNVVNSDIEEVYLLAVFPGDLNKNICQELSFNPWAVFEPQARGIWVPGVVTHTATGVLVGQGSSLSGIAQHNTLHTATGALIGQGSVLSGTANKFITHTATGVLTGQGSTLSGAANRIGSTVHTATGALVGQGSVLSGTATHNALHTATGVLVGQGSTLSGTATHNTLHTATGALIGQGSVLSGESQHLTTHTATGALVGQGSSLSGSAGINGATESGTIGGGGGGAPLGRTEKARKYKNNRKEIEAAIHAAIAQLEIQPVIQKEIQSVIQKIVVNAVQNDYSSEKQLINDAIKQIRIIIDEMNDEEDAIMALIL